MDQDADVLAGVVVAQADVVQAFGVAQGDASGSVDDVVSQAPVAVASGGGGFGAGGVGLGWGGLRWQGSVPAVVVVGGSLTRFPGQCRLGDHAAGTAAV